MLAADPPPTLEALTTLCSSVIQWNERLNALNGQIALRQAELARLEEHRSPPTRSLRNKGSTESLRPRDGPAHIQEDVAAEDAFEGLVMPSSSPPKTTGRNHHAGKRPGSGTPAKAAAQAGAFASPPIPLTATTPKKAPSLKGRPSPHTSSSSPAPGRPGPAKLQKRKTESLASGESAAPKYRTRSMIIVYYDSAVQSAFEELVKFVSGSRNAMRKGKMAARMAEMRRAAEREIEADGESDGDDESFPQLSSAALRDSSARAARNGNLGAGSDSKLSEGAGIPVDPLKASIPRYANPRGSGIQPDGLRSMLSASVIKRSADGERDIFETIDKALEWCQGQCEFAAHKFLREGECGTEIENIKNKLDEVRTTAQKEVEKLEAEEAAAPAPKRPSPRQGPEEGKARDQKPIQVRRSPVKARGLEVDNPALDGRMEVDDEGFEDMDITKLVFKRSRDIAR